MSGDSDDNVGLSLGELILYMINKLPLNDDKTRYMDMLNLYPDIMAYRVSTFEEFGCAFEEFLPYLCINLKPIERIQLLDNKSLIYSLVYNLFSQLV